MADLRQDPIEEFEALGNTPDPVPDQRLETLWQEVERLKA